MRPSESMECPSGIVKECSTYEKEVYKLSIIGMSIKEIAGTLALQPQTINQWISRGELAMEKQESGKTLTEVEKIYVRFARNIALKNKQLQIRLQQLIVSRASKGDIETKDAIAILERISKERWAKQSTLVIEDGKDKSMMEVIAPTVAMVVRGVLDGLGLTEEQMQLVPELLQQSFKRFEIEASAEVEDVEIIDE